MGYHYSIQKVIEYIELNLQNDLTLEELANKANFSIYHFHRVFHTLVGASVMEYVRKRRLVQAANKISCTDIRVIDVALENGFRSHETFTRSFKKLFKMTPSEYRKRRIKTHLYPKANVLQRRYNPYLGGIEMDFRIIKKPEYKVVGYELRTTIDDGRNFKEIPHFWKVYKERNLGAKIQNCIHSDKMVELGICTDFNIETGEFLYIIGAEVYDFDQVEEGQTSRIFPETEFAVFTTPKVKPADFSKSIQETWRVIYEEWFPHSGYEHAGTTEFSERCNINSQNLLQNNIYVPIKKVSF
ncbi:AraC family transcriptional regulator [Bacillus sp. SM2101]|uniref:AraC family transcriptional regulator n=1 Tax=Bacillus sp. SM2101 TaxID=2805366 RepID=UPI001BDF2461|nr:AraC family transcriptional regulator [Bacillus sp. SM2101]